MDVYEPVSLGTALAIRDVLVSEDSVQIRSNTLRRIEINAATSVTKILPAKALDAIMGDREAQRMRALFAQSFGPTFKSSPAVAARDTIKKIEQLLDLVFDGVPLEESEWKHLENHYIARPKFSANFSSILLENAELRNLHVNNGKRLEQVLSPSFKRPMKGQPATPVEDIAPDIEKANNAIKALGPGGFDTGRRGLLVHKNTKIDLNAPAEGQEVAAEAGDAAPDAPLPENKAVGASEPPASPEAPLLANKPNRYEEEIDEEPAASSEPAEAAAEEVKKEVEAPALSFADLSDSEKERVFEAIRQSGFEGDLEQDLPAFSSSHAEGSRLFMQDQMAYEGLVLKRKMAISFRDGVIEDIAAERREKEEKLQRVLESVEVNNAAEAEAEPVTDAPNPLADELAKAQELIEALKVDLSSAKLRSSELSENVARLEALEASYKERIKALEEQLAQVTDNSELEALHAQIAELRAELETRPSLEGEFRNRLVNVINEETAKFMVKTVPALPSNIKGVEAPFARTMMLRPIINDLRIALVSHENDKDMSTGERDLRKFLMQAAIAVLSESVVRNYSMVFQGAMQALDLPLDAKIDTVVEDADVVSFLRFFMSSDGAVDLNIYIEKLQSMEEAVKIAARLSDLAVDDVDAHIDHFKKTTAELNTAREEIKSLQETIEKLKEGNAGRHSSNYSDTRNREIPSPQFLASWEVMNLITKQGAALIAPGVIALGNVIFYIQSDNDPDAVDRGAGVELSFFEALKNDSQVIRAKGNFEFCVISRGDPKDFQDVIRDVFGRSTVHSVSPSESAILKLIKDMKRRPERG